MPPRKNCELPGSFVNWAERRPPEQDSATLTVSLFRLRAWAIVSILVIAVIIESRARFGKSYIRAGGSTVASGGGLVEIIGNLMDRCGEII